MCWEGLTVGQAARIGTGLGLMACAAAACAVLVYETWLAWRDHE